mgnify:CR=1 FL=1
MPLSLLAREFSPPTTDDGRPYCYRRGFEGPFCHWRVIRVVGKGIDFVVSRRTGDLGR